MTDTTDFKQLIAYLRNVSSKSQSIPAQLCGEAADALEKLVTTDAAKLLEEVKNLNKENHELRKERLAPGPGGIYWATKIPNPMAYQGYPIDPGLPRYQIDPITGTTLW